MGRELRTDLWEKLDQQERSFSWFHRAYLSESDFSYNTLYKQAKGQELPNMSNDLKEAIKTYTNQENQ